MSLDRSEPYSKCTFLTSHNAFCNVADGWTWAQQKKSLQGQLEDGIRAFMLDAWLLEIDGVEDIYLLHENRTAKFPGSNFEFKTLKGALQTFTSFLDAHPEEVITVFIETARQEDGGLIRSKEGRRRMDLIKTHFQRYLFDPQSYSKGFDTPLGKMTERLVVFSDYRGPKGGTSENSNDRFGFPLIWHYCRETVHGDASLTTSTWADLRDESKESKSLDVSLGIVNHFPTWIPGTILSANPDEISLPLEERFFEQTNQHQLLRAQALQFFQKYDHIPNFIAVDQYHIGSAQKAVDWCNVFHKETKRSFGVDIPIHKNLALRGVNGEWVATKDADSRKWLLCNGRPRAYFNSFGALGEGTFLTFNRPGSDQDQTSLYLNYRTSSGAVKLFDDVHTSELKLEEIEGSAGFYRVFSLECQQYMRLSSMSGNLYFDIDEAAEDGSDMFGLSIAGTEPVFEQFFLYCAEKNAYVTSPDGLEKNCLLQLTTTGNPVLFERIGPKHRAVVRLVEGKEKALFLSYRDHGKYLKIYKNPTRWSLGYEETSPFTLFSWEAEGHVRQYPPSPELCADTVNLNDALRFTMVDPIRRKPL
ncbi:MAG: hypothetical protein AAF393_14475 [Pseudomonadota bacterium]